MEGHNLVMMQGLEDLVLLQDVLLALRLIWNNFGHKEVACGIFPALSDDTKTAPKGKIKKWKILFLLHHGFQKTVIDNLASTYEKQNKKNQKPSKLHEEDIKINNLR